MNDLGFTPEMGSTRKWTEHLNHYYDKVISSLQKAESLLIMGPGEAKTELKKRLERTTLNRREIQVETVDKLTENQIVEKVREYSLKQHGQSMAS